MKIASVISISAVMAVVVGSVCLYFMSRWNMKQKERELSLKSTEELRSLFGSDTQHVQLLGPAINELKNRGENITFSLPLLLDFVLSANRVHQVCGCELLRTHFQEQLPQIDLTQTRMTEETRSAVRCLRDQIRDLIKT